MPSNSSQNSSTNETTPEYKSYQDYKCPTSYNSFNDFEKSNYNGCNENPLLNAKKCAYREYGRKVQKISETHNYQKENSQSFQFSLFQNELNSALFEQERLFEGVFQKNREIDNKIYEIKSDISELKYPDSYINFFNLII